LEALLYILHEIFDLSERKEDSAPGAVEFHRKTAVACFNGAWDLLDKKDRSREEDLQMLHEAHASR
jgi:hypothetical protein